MHSFTGFLTEEKNLHLEHLEDEILNNGITGTRKAIIEKSHRFYEFFFVAPLFCFL